MLPAGARDGGVNADIRFAARALRHRNYRLFFLGQGVSLIGTWITRVAASWLVYRLTGSALMLGVVGFASLIPTFLLTPLGGVLSDRWPRQRTLVGTQATAMAASLGLAYFALRGTIAMPHVIALSILQGIANAIDIPTRQAFVVEMLDSREDLSSAIALNSTIFNGARLIGPSIAGVLIAMVGEGLCFLIDGVSFLAVIAALLAMRVAPSASHKGPPRVLHELREGFTATFGFAPIRAILGLMAMVSLAGMPYAILLPIFADRVLGGDSLTLGFLTAAAGLGALAGAAYLATRRSIVGLGRVIPTCAALFGAGLIALGLSRILWLSLLIMPLLGFGVMVQMAGSNTIVQTIVDDDKRGRVMGFYAMAFMGMMPVGNLIAGAVARRAGAPLTVMFGGGVCILAAALFASALPRLRSLVRPIYAARGILPPLQEGVGSVAGMGK
jgi:MFS family permease